MEHYAKILPEEVKTMILSNYWQTQFSENIITSLGDASRLHEKISTFINKYCDCGNLYHEVYLHYLKILNEEIRIFIRNDSLKYICKHISSPLYYCYDLEEFISNNINENIKYMCAFALAYSGYNRFLIYRRFQELSILA